jgi:TonB family protein
MLRVLRVRALIVISLALLSIPAQAQPAFTPPVLSSQEVAVYPEEARAAGIEAVVVLELLVDESGRVVDAKVTTPAGHGFDEAALTAARNFRFEPGRADGKPVPVKVTYRYQFVLPHAPEPPPAPEAPPPEPPVRLRGSVHERGTRTPLAEVTLMVLDGDGQQLGEGATAANGDFELRLPAEVSGTLTVVVAAPAHKTLRTREKLHAREVITVNYLLSRSSYAYESTVRSQPAREEVSRVSLDGEEVRRIPGVRGDALAAVLSLPSVARSPFDLGQLVIRGSQPGESGAFLLGMAIPQPFHFGFAVSTFNSFLLDRFDLIPSNFSVRYGRLTGGLVDIVPREGKKDRIHGDIKVDIYDAHVIVEGPIGKGSFALSLRRSYIDAILGLALPSAGFTVAPRYYDYQAMLDYPLGGGKLKLVFYGSDDALYLLQKSPPDADPSLRGQFATRLWFHDMIATWTRKWKDFELESTLLFMGQHQDAALGLAARFNLDVLETDFRTEARWRMSPKARFTFGVDLQTDYFWVGVNAPQIATEEGVQPPLALQDKVQMTNHGFEPNPAIYAQAEWKPSARLVLTPGVRVDWFNGYTRTYVQPRVMARLLVAREMWLKAGVGLFTQPPQPPYNDPVLGNPAVQPEEAVHVTAGLEMRPIPSWRALYVDTNVFYKDIRHLAVMSDQFTLRDGQLKPEVYIDEGIGRVYGWDLLIKHDAQKYVFGWIAYTLMKAERQDHPGEPWRPFQYDQTNILTLVLGTHLPKDFDVGVRFRWVTGNPVTLQTVAVGSPRVYDADRDAYFPGTNPAYGSRLPDFVQLDLRVDKRFVFNKWIFAVYLDVSNVTNRSNVEGYAYSYDFTRQAAVTGLPILPSLGLRASF